MEATRAMLFTDRRDAGRQLAMAVKVRLGEPKEGLVVLGLPRGGVVVAEEVARLLHCPVDVVVVRKVAAPGIEELAIGAVGEAGEPVLNERLIEAAGIPSGYLVRTIETARQEVDRRVSVYRRRSHPDVRGKTVVLVDDGIATGYTVDAAIATLRTWRADRIVLAVPVAPATAMVHFRAMVDDFVVLCIPVEFIAVGQFYADFRQVSDAEVQHALSETNRAAPSASTSAV
jgi:putative phosphoribosyl transferase